MEKNKIIKPVGITLLCIYAAIMIYLMLFMRGQTNYYRYNLIPFTTVFEMISKFRSGGRSTAVINLVGNVIMFVPLGFLVPFAFKIQRKLYRTLLLSFTAIFIMETVQFFARLGSFDVDDIILNLTGVLIGYLCFRVIKKIIGRRKS